MPCELRGGPRQAEINRAQALAAMRFSDHYGYPARACQGSPNGGTGGLMAVITADGRFTAVMPRAELVFRIVQLSWTSLDDSALIKTLGQNPLI